MQKCWDTKPESRPLVSEIIDALFKMRDGVVSDIETLPSAVQRPSTTQASSWPEANEQVPSHCLTIHRADAESNIQRTKPVISSESLVTGSEGIELSST